MSDPEPCPDCAGELKDIIDYVMGCKTAAGRHCTECDYEVIW